jgi:hypothetical protein
LGEFGALIRAAKGENVPVPELKFALIKAIEIMVRVLPLDSTVHYNHVRSSNLHVIMGVLVGYVGSYLFATPLFVLSYYY